MLSFETLLFSDYFVANKRFIYVYTGYSRSRRFQTLRAYFTHTVRMQKSHINVDPETLPFQIVNTFI